VLTKASCDEATIAARKAVASGGVGVGTFKLYTPKLCHQTPVAVLQCVDDGSW
jgi:hypothetical protein